MYIGNDLQIAHPSYKIIDDISSGFNGSTTSFALQVSGATPVPFPISTQQVMISVNGVVQEPDPNGNAGFKLLGSNIVFSSAPANGHAFFGVINAGADYVTAGSEFPDGSATAPSFTFQDDQDTGWFRSGSGAVGYSANGVQTLTFDGNGLTVTGDASFVGDSSKNLLWDKSDGQLEFADSAKAVFGAGSDLSIYHNGSHSYINDSGTGDLNIVSSRVQILNSAISEYMARFVENGAVELYHDNVKKFETLSSGVKITGLNATGSSVLGDFRFKDEDDNLDIHYDAENNKLHFYDNNKATFGTGNDLTVWHNGTNSYIQNATGDLFIESASDIFLYNSANNEYYAKCIPNGAVELYHNNVKKAETGSGGLTVQGQVSVAGSGVSFSAEDNGKAAFGNGDDLKIFHDGSHNKIECSNGQLHIKSSQVDFINAAGSEYMLRASQDGAVSLYYDNGLRFYTRSNGCTIDGTSTQSSLDLRTANAYRGSLYADNNNDLGFLTASGAWRFKVANSGDVTAYGTVSDTKGNLRSIPQNAQSTYTLVAADAGKHILATGNITVPNAVFSAGDAVTIVNNTASNLTITKTINTMYNAADGSSANRTLAARGMVTILFTSGTLAYISGAGLS